MSFTLGRYINKAVRVSIPTLFPDGPDCVAIILAVDPAGVWFQSEALVRRVYPHNPPESARVFIPFTQIAYLAEDMTEPGSEHADQESPRALHPKPKRPGHRGAMRHKQQR